MRHVDVSWSQLAGHRLCQTPQREFARGKGGISRTAANRGGCPGEEDRALLPLHHVFSGFAPGQKRAVSAHFPDLAKDAFGRFQNGKPNIAADIEDADVYWSDISASTMANISGRGLFLAGVPGEPLCAAACRLDFGDQGRKFFPAAAAHHDMKPSRAKRLAMAAPI